MKKRMKITSAIMLLLALTMGSLHAKVVSADTLSVDDLYKNAYVATVNALNVRTQKSVNAARVSINALSNTGASWAIGEFSKQVDTVQQPIFTKAYNAIVQAQQYINQTSINAARNSIDPDMPDYYRNSYSQAVDLVEQSLMQSALTAEKKAIASKSQADIDALNLILADIKTSINPDIVTWVNAVTYETQTALGQGGSGNNSQGGTTTTDTTAPTINSIVFSTNSGSVTVVPASGVINLSSLFASAGGTSVTSASILLNTSIAGQNDTDTNANVNAVLDCTTSQSATLKSLVGKISGSLATIQKILGNISAGSLTKDQAAKVAGTTLTLSDSKGNISIYTIMTN